MAKTTDTIMTLDNLAACAKRSRPSPYKLYQAGKTPGTKVGCHWRFHKDAIDAWGRSGVPPTQVYGRSKSAMKIMIHPCGKQVDENVEVKNA